MTMIDADKLKPALEAWQIAAAFVVLSSQSADAAYLRGEHKDADQMAERTQQALRTLEEKAHNLAKLVEALIYQAEHPNG